MEKTNTHTYDGKLSLAKRSLSSELARVSQIPKGKKLENFTQMKGILQRFPGFIPQAAHCFETIFRTFSTDGHVPRGTNYDPTNDLHADDLLYLCYEKLEEGRNKDFAEGLLLQLQEMAGGLCAQGRTTRLFQLLLAY